MAAFTVTLSIETGFTVTVDYATGDGFNGAEAGSDYKAISGTLTFHPGETLKRVEVAVFGDTTFEPDEKFDFKLSNANPLNLPGMTTSATILNDDFRVYLPLVSRLY